MRVYIRTSFKIHSHTRQTGYRNEYKLSKNRHTWMHNQKKDYPEKKIPLWKGTAPKSYRPITCLPINTNGPNKGGDLLFVYKPRTVSRRTEKMPAGNKRNRRGTIHWSIRPQREQKGHKEMYLWRGLTTKRHIWKIDSLKTYKISNEVKRFIEKTFKT